MNVYVDIGYCENDNQYMNNIDDGYFNDLHLTPIFSSFLTGSRLVGASLVPIKEIISISTEPSPI